MYKLAQIFFSHFSDPFDSTANTSHSQSVLQNHLHGSVVSFFDKTSINQIRRKREKMDRNLLLIITLFVLYTISSKNYSIIIFCYKTKNRREPKKVKRKKRVETSVKYCCTPNHTITCLIGRWTRIEYTKKIFYTCTQPTRC